VVAEDSEEVRMLSVKILEGQGYKVYAAPDGSECLRIVNELNGSVDMLITDVIMPDMNGKSLYMRIAEKYPHTKVLYMSGYADSTFTQNGILEEGTAYIQKPFSAAGLAGKVREVLDSR
jgi:CheY-like chemotaxis protein